ncbi:MULTISPECIES: TIGR00341 family protein [unclassified Haladaptatus]|uniref:TIGR00341 family protein n=1 Tax=unclassified Haladaptatus TaxID=2622732 RepID=UPI0023E8C3A4|nr:MULTISPECIES: TIGR00341 family protein [unclassified Haladaptatus]
MRLVQVTIPAGKREAILDTLDDEGIDYVLTDETSGREFTGVVSFPLPTNAVEHVLGRLREVGVEDEAYTVVIDAETVISRRFEALQEKYDESDQSDERIAREELVTTATNLAPSMVTYLTMTVVSGVIATAGLLLDSPAVVVGSMVIAPLIGPAMAASVGTVIDDRDLFLRGVKLQLIGFAAAIAAAALFSWLVKTIHLIPPGIDPTEIGQVRERLSPDFLSLMVALGAGVAGAFSLSAGVSASLVGVMIAVALVPPAAAVGIGIAWGLPMVVLGSGVLALVNALSINLAAITTLWYTGYRPDRWFKLDSARSRTLKRAGVLIAAILVLSLFLGGVTLASFSSANAEENIQTQIETTLDRPAYDEVTLLDVEVEFTESALTRSPSEVVVTVGLPPDVEKPPLAAELDAAITENFGYDVDLQVRFVELQSA